MEWQSALLSLHPPFYLCRLFITTMICCLVRVSNKTTENSTQEEIREREKKEAVLSAKHSSDVDSAHR